MARKRGVSLQDLLRQMLESLVGERTADELADELFELFRTAPGRSERTGITRADAYEGRV